jgi:uncharacterized protein (TIGR03083 family)
MIRDAVPDSDEAYEVPPPDKSTAADQLEAALDQFCDLLLSVDDLCRPAVGHWTVGDVAAHIAGGSGVYAAIVAGKGSPFGSIAVEDIAVVSDRSIAEIGDRDVTSLVERIRAGGRTLTSAARAQDGNPTVPWHAGTPVPLSALLGLFIGEVLVHGYDIAHASDRHWQMPQSWAHTAFRSMVPLVPLYLDQDRAGDLRANFDVRMRGECGLRVVFAVADHRVTVCLPQPGRKADCYLSADPATLLLVLFGRIGPTVPALTGKVFAWGRKPWLGFILPSLFRTP